MVTGCDAVTSSVGTRAMELASYVTAAVALNVTLVAPLKKCFDVGCAAQPKHTHACFNLAAS